MINRDFYPTPAALADKMLAPYWGKLGGKYVLDPSAGKGDLLDAVRRSNPADQYSRYEPYLHAVEIEPELQSVLVGKGYPVMAADFLAYTPNLRFDLIVMNPPFSDCRDHLLHAWDILDAGEIVCLLPETALQGAERKANLLRDIIAQYGMAEPVGQAFRQAERTTAVPVLLIRLRKVDGTTPDIDFTVRNDRADPLLDDGPGAGLLVRGFIAELLQAHDAAIAGYAAYSQAREEVLRAVKPLNAFYSRKPPKNAWSKETETESVVIMDAADKQAGVRERYNTFTRLITESAWNHILDHPDFQAVLTERARKALDAFRLRQQRVDFNPANIRAFFDTLMGMRGELAQGAVLDAFDTLTRWHKDNRVHVEGWKSNEAYLAAPRCVLPNFLSQPPYNFGIAYNHQRELDDVDRALCVVSGREFRAITPVSTAVDKDLRARWDQRSVGDPRAGACDSTFFDIRYFKKGTIHLKFKDEDVWTRFNVMACNGRKWLPPDHARSFKSVWKQPARKAQEDLGL